MPDEGTGARRFSERLVVEVPVCAPLRASESTGVERQEPFLSVYRSFKSVWTPISAAGQFDIWLKSIIGTFILVTFNSNKTKVGTHQPQGDTGPRHYAP